MNKQNSNKLFKTFLSVSIFSALLLPTGVIAAPTLEAIWESYSDNQQTKKAQPKTANKLTAAEIKAIRLAEWEQANPAKSVSTSKKPQVASKPARAKQKTNVTQTDEKLLAKQRIAWKKKWEAEQAKKLARKKPQAKNNKAPVKLTRAQYQERFKKQQLEKKQSANKSTQKVTRKFTSGQRKAQFNHLPLEIVSKLKDAGVNQNGMSTYVQDVSSKQPLLAYQDQASRVPASVMKLITSYVALGTLGPNYRWPLDIYTRGKIHKGTLTGDLIVKGYGAPDFNKAELSKVLKAIKGKGIHSVKGRVVFDNSYFQIPKENAGDFDGKAFASYNAQPDALLFNERISEFSVRANRKGKRVSVSTSTPTHGMKIVNKMRKTRRGCRPRISVSNRGATSTVTFSGTFSTRCGTRSYSRVISRPSEMIYGSMKAMWKRDVGGNLSTQFAMGKVPNNAKPLVTTYSKTLTEILPSIDKDSNNVMARQLLLSIGAKKSGKGTPRSGANAVSQWLASRGLNFPELRIENGSGLSRLARISARHVGDLLMDAYHSPYRNHLMQSLAIAGVDGTMKRRLRGTPVRGRGFFKTGTLKDVRSIAGYVKAANGRTYIVSILHNDPRARSRSVSAHNSLIEWVYEGGKGNQRLALR